MGNVHYMHQNISFPNLVKGALEGFHQLCRQFSDEAYSVTQQERHIFYHHLSYSCVKGGEQFVFCKDITLGKQIHQGALPDIGISYERNPHQGASVASL